MKLVASVGGFSTGSPAAISYLWTNWHDYFCIDRTLFNVRRLSKASWEASAHSVPGSGEWHLLESKFNPTEGYFRFISYVKFAGQLVRGESSFIYQRTSGDECWFVAETSGRLPQILNPMSPLLAPVVAGLAKEFGGNGGRVAAEISRDPALIQRRCGVAAIEKYREYVADEAALRNGTTTKLEHMSQADEEDHESAELLDQLFGSSTDEFLSLRAELKPSVKELALLQRATIYARYRVPFAGSVMLGWIAERLWRQQEAGKLQKVTSLAEFVAPKRKMVWAVSDGEQRFTADIRQFGNLYLKLVRIGALVSRAHG